MAGRCWPVLPGLRGMIGGSETQRLEAIRQRWQKPAARKNNIGANVAPVAAVAPCVRIDRGRVVIAPRG